MERRIDYPGLRKLLSTLESCEDVLIRIRCAGEAWQEFSQLLLLSESAMILQTDSRRNIVMNVRNIAEFELDGPCLDFEPRAVYRVVRDI